MSDVFFPLSHGAIASSKAVPAAEEGSWQILKRDNGIEYLLDLESVRRDGAVVTYAIEVRYGAGFEPRANRERLAP